MGAPERLDTTTRHVSPVSALHLPCAPMTSARSFLRFVRTSGHVLQRGPSLLWEVPIETGTWAVARKTRHRGVTIGLFLLGDQSPLVIREQVTKALDLIAEVDPRRYTGLRHDHVRVLVEDGPMSHYLSLTNTCVLSLDVVQNQPTERIALTIVHEATHARLYRGGVGYDRKNQARRERRCVLEQVDFLRRLAALGYRGTEARIQYYQNALSRPWWGPEAIHKRVLEYLRRSEFSGRLIRLYDVLCRPR
jgi:hypothetical protein